MEYLRIKSPRVMNVYHSASIIACFPSSYSSKPLTNDTLAKQFRFPRVNTSIRVFARREDLHLFVLIRKVGRENLH